MHKRNDKDKGHRRSLAILFLFVLILSAASSFAHPMGNFSINHYSKVTIKDDSVEIVYLIDMAEIPTFQETRQFGVTPLADDPSVSRYLERQEQLLKPGVTLDIDGRAFRLDTISHQITFA